MARVAGVDLPREKRGEVAVTYIYGLGRSTGRRILLRANVDPSKRVKAWSDDEVNRIRELIERELKVEGDLRREVSMNVKRLMDIGAYRGSGAGGRPGGGAEEGRSVRHGRRSQTSTTEEGREAARAARSPHWHCSHPGDVQQHDRHAHRPHGERRV